MTIGINIFTYISKIRHYIIFNLCYVLLLFFYIIDYYYWDLFYDTAYFYFDAPYGDFKLWFPRYHFIAYSLIVIVQILFVIFVLWIIYFFLRRIISNRNWLYYNHQVGYFHFVSYEFAVALPFFLFYIILYLLAKRFAPVQLYDGLQVVIARGFLFHLIFHSVTVFLGNFKRIRNYLKNYLLLPQLPYNISALRILFFSYLVFIYVTKYFSALPIVSLPVKTSLPYWGWIIDFMPINPSLYSIFIVLGILSCLFIIFGFKTKWFLIVNALCVFYVIAAPNFFGKLWHEQIIIWISWFFVFSRCYDVFSIDAILDKKVIVKSADYTFPVRFILLQFGVIYFWAGFYKLWDCGFDWALSQSMVNQVQLEWLQNYDKIPAIRIDNYPTLLKVGGLCVIVFELCYILFVLDYQKRWIAAIGGLLMHNIIGYFMYIYFLSLLQVFYIFYIDFTCLFYKKGKQYDIMPRKSKWALRFGIVILSLNFLCGMFSIDSYPFSAYPKYAALIPDSIKIVHFEPYFHHGEHVDVHSIGKQNNFRWEEYGWLEYNLIKDFENGDDVEQRVQDYWRIWLSYNSEFAGCDSVRVYVTERAVSPAGIGNEKIIDYICTIP